MRGSNRKNPHRLIRAIEIARQDQKSPPEAGQAPIKYQNGVSKDVLIVGLTAPREILYQRIDERVEEMFRQGLLEEVKGLAQKYGSDAPGMKGIGYRQLKAFFDGKSSLLECKQKIKYDTHAYARRQITWFRRDKNIHWFDITKESFDKETEALVKSYLK